MEELNLRYKAIQQALFTLKEGLDEVEMPIVDRPKAYKLMRDGVTQRFEYCIDLFWKFFKLYCDVVSKISIESPSPNKIVRLLLNLRFISDQESNILFMCVTERNLTSHTYDEKTAEKIHEHIPLYYVTMKSIVDRLDIAANL